MNCDMCGKPEARNKTNIEGSVMMLCENCSGYGQVIETKKSEMPKKRSSTAPTQVSRPMSMSTPPKRNMLIQELFEDYGTRIKRKRESMELKQSELAQRLQIKESLLTSIESGKFKPNLDMARKFEKILHIELIDQREEQLVNTSRTESEGMTLGDIIKF